MWFANIAALNGGIALAEDILGMITKENSYNQKGVDNSNQNFVDRYLRQPFLVSPESTLLPMLSIVQAAKMQWKL
jgi:hypothetical protein